MSEIRVDTITEKTSANGVAIDSVTLKDGGATLADNITFSASGKGVHLGVTTATAGNLLDDYEEGDYTAAWTIGTGTITLHSSYNQLTYTKVGRMVHIQGYLESSAESSASGTLRMNLPFTVDGSFTDLGERGGTSALLTLTAHNVGSHWWATINGDGANIRLFVASSATNVSDTGGTSVDGECTAYVNITYQTSS